jgi:hypothetical protein
MLTAAETDQQQQQSNGFCTVSGLVLERGTRRWNGCVVLEPLSARFLPSPAQLHNKKSDSYAPF